ncbi:alpha-amylase family glycosyl hydrolase, partial [Salmonella enterica]|uniref:alpha-amylase family glycosyl hydrolase n=1 Tax=Salmonella enterica TaxID=28901 RepID=UPI001EEEF6E3
MQRLDYIRDLGCDCVWLSPVLVSPQRDGGYDVEDYRHVDARYGGDDAFDALVAACHARGIKVMLDFVGNHTSSDHVWYRQESAYKRAQARLSALVPSSALAVVAYRDAARTLLRGGHPGETPDVAPDLLHATRQIIAQFVASAHMNAAV